MSDHLTLRRLIPRRFLSITYVREYGTQYKRYLSINSISKFSEKRVHACIRKHDKFKNDFRRRYYYPNDGSSLYIIKPRTVKTVRNDVDRSPDDDEIDAIVFVFSFGARVRLRLRPYDRP